LQKPFIKLHHCPVLNIPTASLFVGIATLSVTGYIAWQQMRTAKNKFRLDLFDRRFPVFEAAMKFVSIAAQKGDVSEEARQEFLIATRGVEFLFDRKIQDYCDKLINEAVNLHHGFKLKDLPRSGAPEQDAKHIKRIETWSERAQWFNEQVEEVPKRFGPFLRVRG
jgi:hypothetical protein